jgi:hypothetical protein
VYPINPMSLARYRQRPSTSGAKSDAADAHVQAENVRLESSLVVRHQLELFERVVNLMRWHAPDAAIAFKATPADTFEAAARWVQIPG